MFNVLINTLFRAKSADKLSFLDDILFFLEIGRTKNMGIIIPTNKIPCDLKVRRATLRAIKKAPSEREKKSYRKIAKNLGLIEC